MRAKAALLALCAALLLQQAAAFIRVYGTSFADESCREFAFVGANTWRMLEAQAGTTGVKLNGINPVTNLLDTAAALNITVLRAFATGVTPELPVQVQEGTYNPAALEALDQMMADAANRGLRVTLILARNWGGPDSRAQYAGWNGLQSPDDFFSSEPIKVAYKNHVTFVVNRTNTVNGRVYRDDPTIFSWNLMNEPRFFFNGTDDPCAKDPASCTAKMQAWIEEMSAFLKSMDKNHLVTVGEEGFWSKNSTESQFNPQPDAGWAAATGQDFTMNHNIKTIDYGGFHIWPDNWNITDPTFYQRWIGAHMDSARKMGKPLVLEEAGKNVSDQNPATIENVRNPVFSVMFDALAKSLQTGDMLKGAMYWMWDPVLVGPSSPGWGNYSQDQVMTDSSTMKNIIAPAAKAAAEYKGQVPGCVPQTATAQAGRKMLSVPLPWH